MSREQRSSSHSQSGYDEYQIEIGLGAERAYPLSIRSAGGALKTTFTMPFDEYALVQGLQALLDAGGGGQQAKQSTQLIVREWGQALFTALFPAEARSLYDVSLRMATERGRYLQLRLNIQAPELAVLPWEYLYDPRRQEPTVLARQTPIVRTLDIPQPIETLLVEHRLRILVMVAAPRDLPELEMTREQERIATAVAGLQQRGLVEVVWMTGQTWRDLLGALRNGPWHIFHFIGHGGFDTATEEGFLVLTDAQGNPTPLSATHLARLLADQRTLRLVLLNTCGGASGSSYSLFASTATTLVRRNIPAVLTMQSAISDHAAIELTQTFYEALADGFSITAATSEARIAMSLAVPNSIEWGTPVLYMRGPDSVLFAWPADTEVIGISTAEAKRLSVPALPLSFGTADTDSPLNIRKQNNIQRRRLDAAAPSTATLHRPIDLLVQVRFADSPLLGLDDWPVRTKPTQIEQVSELVQLTYPVDPQTGKLRPALLQIRVNTSDFIVQGREQQVIEVSPVEYSKRINFLLQPHKTGPLRVQIEAYNLSDVYLGSIPLEMEILADREIPLFAAPTVGNLSITVLVNSPVADSRSQPTSEKRLADRKAKESESTDEVDSSETVETETTIDNRSGGVYFEGNQSVKIKGDVISGGAVNKTNFQGPVTGPVHTGSGNINYIDLAALLPACRKWFDKTLRLAAIPPHLNTSWAGRSIYVMRQLTDGLSAQQWWTFITACALWVATIWLVTPILQWPLADATSRGRACFLYAIATLVIPFFVALTAPVDRQAEMALDTPLVKWRFWFLKLTGAYTGFALAAGAIGVALLAYYLGWTLPRGVQWLLALVPFLFSHIGARRIPGDRLKMFGEVRLHEVDRLVVIVFLLLGPGVAAFIYWGYSVIANPGTGLLLLIALSGLALWEVRQRQRTAFADWALIAVFGLLLPLTFMLFVFYFTMPGSLPSTSAWWALAVVTPYFLGLSLLVATIFVRNPPTLTIRGVVGLLIVFLLIAYLTNLNVWLGRGLLGAVVLFWVLWGRRIWRRYFWMHASFGWMLIVLIGSIYLWVQTVTPHWIALVGFFLATGLLMKWAYQPQTKASSDAADYL